MWAASMPYRIRGEAHMWRPTVVADLQHAVRGNLARQVSLPMRKQINDQTEQLMTLRGLFRLKSAEEMGRQSRRRSRRWNRRPTSCGASRPER